MKSKCLLLLKYLGNKVKNTKEPSDATSSRMKLNHAVGWMDTTASIILML